MSGCSVTLKTTPDGSVFESAQIPWPLGSMVRVRDGLRHRSHLQDGVLSERAIIFEIRIEGDGWQEIDAIPYVHHLEEEAGKVPRLLPAAFEKRRLLANMFKRAKHHMMAIEEATLYGG